DHLVFKDTLAPYGFVSFSTSPEGKSFAWIRTSPDYSGDLVIVDLESGVERQATFTKTMKDEVFWTRDNFLIYSSFANNNFDLWISPAEGGEPQPLTVSLQDEVQAQLSDDGKKMLYYERSFFGNIKALDLETGNTTSITNDDKRRRSLIVSPDGRYFVYSRNARSGRRYFLQTELVGYDRTLEKPEWTIVKEKGIGLRSWSHDGKWIAYVSIPDSIGRGFKLCIVSPFDGSRPRVLAVGTEMRSLYWLDEQRVGWFADMKTWVCSIDKPEPRQFYQDSTIAFSVQNGRYVLFQDLRVGRLGWWLADVTSPSSSTSRILIDAAELLWWPFVLTTTPNQTLQKISLPGGKKENLKVKIPSNWVNLRMSADLKTLYGIEIVSTSNLILWENPFIWE
ncbi:MAG: transcriptional regulatory protein-like protein, partial [Bacteroidetes bacterium]|nr:transcriptional regulatory protein-like protein [Bacteroidota bacterium]